MDALAATAMVGMFIWLVYKLAYKILDMVDKEESGGVLGQEVQDLRERVVTLEAIAVDKDPLAKEIEALPEPAPMRGDNGII